jgi:hypothetical protein
MKAQAKTVPVGIGRRILIQERELRDLDHYKGQD